MDQRLQKVQLVTERYSELKGLHVAYAGVLWATFGALLYVQPEVTATNLVATFVGVVVAYLPAKWWLDRYYASRFGRTVNSRLRRSRIWMVPAFVALVISDQVFGMGPVGGGFLIVAAESLWIAMRDWPARGHYLVASPPHSP